MEDDKSFLSRRASLFPEIRSDITVQRFDFEPYREILNAYDFDEGLLDKPELQGAFTVADLKVGSDEELADGTDLEKPFGYLSLVNQRQLDWHLDRYFRVKLNEISGTPAFWRWEDRFFRVYRKQITDAFPIDEDIRQVISSLRYVVARNLISFIVVKRMIAFFTVGLAIILMAMFNNQYQDMFPQWISGSIGDVGALVGASILSISVSAFLFWFTNRIASGMLKDRLQKATGIQSNNFEYRFSDLRSALTGAKQHIDRCRFEIADKSEWANYARLTTVVLIWLSRRAEYIERFLHAEIWRVRRMLLIANIIALSTILVFGAVFLVLIWILNSSGFLTAGQAIVSALFSLFVLFASYYYWNPAADTVENFINSGSRFASLRMHKHIGDQIRDDKREIMRLESLIN